MLSKHKRLNLKTAFKWVLQGTKLEGQMVKLYIREGDNEVARIGISISSKIFKNAVERNKVKRIVSLAFEKLYDKLPSTINIVALPKRGILENNTQNFNQELERLLIEKAFLK